MTIHRTLPPILILALTGCLKNPDFKQDFGPEVPFEEVQKKMLGISRSSPFVVAPGEMAYLETTQQIEANPPLLIAQEKTEVLSRQIECSARLILFDIAVTVSKLENNSMTPPATVVGGGRLELSDEEHQQLCGAKKAAEVLAKKIAPQSARRVTYHNLREQSFLYPVPPLVQTRNNCGGLSQEVCRAGIPAKSVAFDQVVWEEEKGFKTSVLTITTDQTPFFANVLSQCLETNVDVTSNDGTPTRARVRQCDTIKDFTFGSLGTTVNE